MGVNRKPLSPTELTRYNQLDALSPEQRRATGTQVEYMALRFRFAIYTGKRN
jgi:hypothetical protein